MKLKHLATTAFFFFFCLFIQAQELNKSTIFKEGDKLFKGQQYVKAMRFYKQVLEMEPGHGGALFQMGECYRLMFDYENALYYYKKVSRTADASFPLGKFYYAEMLKHVGKFDEALTAFEEFMQHLKELELHEDEEYRKYYKQAKIEKEGCLLALNDLTNPKPDHHFELCEDDINSEYMDFAAFTYNDDQYLCLTSSRSGGRGNMIDYRFGESFADIFRYQNNDGTWEEYSGSDRLEKTINTKWGDGSGSFNREGTKFYYTNCNEKLGDVCHIYVSHLVNGNWTEPTELGEAINVPGYDSRHPNITPGGDTLFFASNRPGGQGNYDIWMSINGGSGENWSRPINLGDQINTAFMEISPFYDIRQKALFFSSDGHRGYGGFDIFMAKGLKFFDPKIYNPGAPYNSNKDDVFMFFGKHRGYLSSNRDGGFGKLDIYEFEIEREADIITEISADELVAGRNSLFSDDYDFDSEQEDEINEIISRFLAARVVDVDIALTSELAKVYQGLSLDDKERITRIIHSRIRKLNEKDLQTLRIEDEFYYRNLASKDKTHMDNLITRYIEENELALSVQVDPEDNAYYKSLSDENRTHADNLIATRVKQANSYEYRADTYRSLSATDQKQVDQIAQKYLKDKTSLDKLTISPSQAYFLKNLDDQQKDKIYTSIKEKVLNLSKDSKYTLTEDDRIFYQNLSSEHLEALKSIASSFVLSDVENLETYLNVEELNLYKRFNDKQKQQLNRILVKIIDNTIKSDIYFAEANLLDADKDRIARMDPQHVDQLIQEKELEEDHKEKLQRFLTVSADEWAKTENIFIVPDLEPLVVTAKREESEDNVTEKLLAGPNETSGKNESAPEKNQETEIKPVVESDQKIETLSASALGFYQGMDPKEQKAVDRIIAMEYINKAYQDKDLKAEDDVYYKTLKASEKTYLDVLIKDLRGEELDAAEQAMLKEAYAYYSGLSSAVKAKWNRLVARESLVANGNRYRISSTDASYRSGLDAESRNYLSDLQAFRSSNQRLLSENIAVEANDSPNTNVNFDVAKFHNTDHKYVSIEGTLIDNNTGAPLSNTSLLVVNKQDKTIAKASTGRNGAFHMDGLPRGNYRVVIGDDGQKSDMGAKYFVKGLKVTGSDDTNFRYQVKTNIYFDFDSHDLRNEARVTLREIAGVYSESPVYIELKSHTDNIGAETYNQKLSARRNESAIDMLKQFGVEASDLVWVEMGTKSPVAPNTDAYGRQFNRRIEITLKSNEPINYQPADIFLVRPKGTLYSIAKNFETDIATLKRFNGLHDSNIEAYRPIRIPNPKDIRPYLDLLVELDPSVARTSNIYEVRPGETVDIIARKFNLPEELIMEMNGLKSLDVKAGRKLKIYIRDY